MPPSSREADHRLEILPTPETADVGFESYCSNQRKKINKGMQQISTKLKNWQLGANKDKFNEFDST
jgi:hypothetical protein